MSKRCSADEIEYIKNNYLHKTYGEICKELKRDRMTICNVCKKFGWRSPKSIYLEEQEKLYQQNLKKCNKCLKILPLTKEFFTFCSGPSRQKPFWQSACKKCDLARVKRGYNSRYSSLEKYAKSVMKAIEKDRRKYPVTIILEDIINQYHKQNGLCHYSKEILKLESHSDWTISIDRLDSSKGYIQGNVVLCCKVINYMKQKLSESDFNLWCQKVANNHQCK